MTPAKRQAAAGLVRKMIADGTLKPGGAAPSGAALGRLAGCSTLTARTALRRLLADGTLVPGVSQTARLRVAQTPRASMDTETAKLALAKALAARRRSFGLTQPELAAKVGMSVTTIGHAETGRLWQSRRFWLRADQELGGTGDLLRMFDDFEAARSVPRQDDREDSPAEEPAPVLPVSVTITTAGVVAVWPDGSESTALPPPPGGGPDGRGDNRAETKEAHDQHHNP